jgi:hypothetical protein
MTIFFYTNKIRESYQNAVYAIPISPVIRSLLKFPANHLQYRYTQGAIFPRVEWIRFARVGSVTLQNFHADMISRSRRAVARLSLRAPPMIRVVTNIISAHSAYAHYVQIGVTGFLNKAWPLSCSLTRKPYHVSSYRRARYQGAKHATAHRVGNEAITNKARCNLRVNRPYLTKKGCTADGPAVYIRSIHFITVADTDLHR